MDAGDRISRPARLALLAPAVLVIAVCLAGPLTLLLSYSFAPGGSTRANFSEGLTLENYIGVLGDTFYLGIILKTLWLSVIVTLAAILVGWPLAYFLWKAPERFKTLCTLVYLFGFFIVGPTLIVFGFAFALSARPVGALLCVGALLIDWAATKAAYIRL